MGINAASRMVTCDGEGCDQSATKEELAEDKMRFYRTDDGVLCELCKDEYDERHETT